jgi:hypothetical protein
MAINQFVARNGVISLSDVQVTGSLGVTGNITTPGTITAQTLYIQTVTASQEYSSGSNVFGNALTNTQQFTGSVLVTGSLNTVGTITGTSFTGAGTGLTGTASSLSIGGNAATATSATSATSATTATSASYATNATNATSATSAATATSASYATNATNATSATSATTATSASYAANTSETLATVTGRGASTSTPISISGNSTSSPLLNITQTGTSGYAAIKFSGNNGTDTAVLTTYSGNIYIGRFNGGNGAYGDILINTTNGNVTFGSSVTASSFSGAGTGLTGTASSLSIGGNAATATSASYASTATSAPNYLPLAAGSGSPLTGNLYLGSTSGGGTGTTSPTFIDLGNTFGTNAVGSNYKLRLFDATNNIYGLGVSSGLFEFNTGNNGNFGFYYSGSTTPVMYISGSGGVTNIGSTGQTNLIVGNISSTGIFTSSGRGNVEVNGTSTSIFGLTINNAAAGYLYHTGTTLNIYNYLNNGAAAITLNNNTTLNGTLTATSFSGAGTGLTGTASSLSIGGNAATATSATSATSATVSTYMPSQDTRSTASTPQTNDASQGIRFDFKSNSTNGLSDGGSFNGVMYFRKYGSSTDWTGGGAHEVGFTDSGNIYHRYGSNTTWGSWIKLLDSNNYNSYSPTLTGTGASGTWGINITGNATVLNDTSGTASALRIVSPGGASYATSSPTATGAIKITLPQGYTSTMMRMTVKIYTYDGQGCEINLGGYNYTPGSSWYNTFADMTTGARSPMNVRFGFDGTYCCIYIGETSSTWNYPQVFVTDFQAGFSNYGISTWNSGWSVSFATTLSNVTQTNTTAGVVYGSTGYFTGDVIAYYSDKRLKTNIRPIENALSKVMQIGGYFYNPNDLAVELGATQDKDEKVGVLAQEIQVILPHAIKDAPFDKTGTYITVQYEKLVPLLIEAIKEQQTQIEELKTLVNQLLNK